MIAAMVLPFKRCLDFRGRSRRSEFWGFAALQLILLVAAAVISFGVPAIANGFEVLIWYMIIHALLFALPMLAVLVRRMHDQDRSGWWALGFFLPYIGAGFILYFMAQPGTWGPNRFGPDPRHVWEGDLFE